MGCPSGSRSTLGKRVVARPRRFESCPHRMRIIFLNLERGNKGQPLFDFITSNINDTDIFCFQEATELVLNKIKKLLPQFNLSYFEKVISKNKIYAIAAFIRKEYLFENEQRILDGDLTIGIAESFNILVNPKKVSVSNVHGIPYPGDKKDNEARIRQSKNIIDHISKIKPFTIIGGDFNLLPETESIKMFEKSGFRNLIKEFKIKTTRSKNAWKEAQKRNQKENPFFGKQDFADYCFVSPEVKVINFEVPNIEVYDHLPLILDFEI